MANVSVHRRRTLCAVRVERIVRIFILAARMFHSQFQIVFSSAESGRISGQADLHIFYPNVSVHPRRTLCAVGVERIVRIFILAARLFHSQLRIVFSSAESGRICGQADLHIFYPNVTGQEARHLWRVS